MASSYEEEREFVLRFSLRARFPEDYEGDADGYAWARAWESEVKPAVLRAVFAELRRHEGWHARIHHRGIAPEREVEIAIDVPIDF